MPPRAQPGEPAPKLDPKQRIESVRDKLTVAEMRELGDELAQTVSAIEELLGAKKATVADLTAQHKILEARACSIASMMKAGYRLREVMCALIYDMPCEGRKSVKRLDNQEIIRDEPMTPEEMQRAFKFDDGSKKPQ